MARVPVAFAFVAASISLGAFIAQVVGKPYSSSRWFDAGFVLLWLSIGVSLAFARRASVAAWMAQLVAALAAVAFVVVALVELYSVRSGPRMYSVADKVEHAYTWMNGADAMAVAAVAFGLAGDRVRTPAIRAVFVVMMIAALACLGYAWSSQGFSDAGWWAGARVAALLAASAAARMEAFHLPRSRG